MAAAAPAGQDGIPPRIHDEDAVMEESQTLHHYGHQHDGAGSGGEDGEYDDDDDETSSTTTTSTEGGDDDGPQHKAISAALARSAGREKLSGSLLGATALKKLASAPSFLFGGGPEPDFGLGGLDADEEMTEAAGPAAAAPPALSFGGGAGRGGPSLSIGYSEGPAIFRRRGVADGPAADVDTEDGEGDGGAAPRARARLHVRINSEADVIVYTPRTAMSSCTSAGSEASSHSSPGCSSSEEDDDVSTGRSGGTRPPLPGGELDNIRGGAGKGSSGGVVTIHESYRNRVARGQSPIVAEPPKQQEGGMHVAATAPGPPPAAHAFVDSDIETVPGIARGGGGGSSNVGEPGGVRSRRVVGIGSSSPSVSTGSGGARHKSGIAIDDTGSSSSVSGIISGRPPPLSLRLSAPAASPSSSSSAAAGATVSSEVNPTAQNTLSNGNRSGVGSLRISASPVVSARPPLSATGESDKPPAALASISRPGALSISAGGGGGGGAGRSAAGAVEGAPMGTPGFLRISAQRGNVTVAHEANADIDMECLTLSPTQVNRAADARAAARTRTALSAAATPTATAAAAGASSAAGARGGGGGGGGFEARTPRGEGVDSLRVGQPQQQLHYSRRGGGGGGGVGEAPPAPRAVGPVDDSGGGVGSGGAPLKAEGGGGDGCPPIRHLHRRSNTGIPSLTPTANAPPPHSSRSSSSSSAADGSGGDLNSW